jgi:hypothetical protein
MYNMKINIYMFHMDVKYRVSREVSSSKVVTPESLHRIMRNSQFLEEEFATT